MKQKVVIIGVSYSSRLALARSIGILDCDITIIAWGVPGKNGKPIDAYSKYVSRWLICPKEEDAFIDTLKKQCTDPVQKVVLIPDCDFSVAMIDSHQDELRPYFYMPHINERQGAIVAWSDKMKQKQLASSIGLNVANSSIIRIENGKYLIPESISYPCFPKALASVAGGKAGMWRCDNTDDLDRALQDIIRKKMSTVKVLVEDYKSIEKEYAVLGFSDGESVSIPAIIQFIEGSRTQKGIALQGKVMPITGFEEIIEHFESLMKRIGFWGLFDIDFYESDGKCYFSELNLRYGGSGYAVVKMGVNLPSMFVNSILGRSMESMNKTISGVATYTNERICYNDLINGYISSKEYNQYINSSDILFIKDPDDSKPYEEFLKIVRTAKMKFILKKVLKWHRKH
jgi:predicted ATP-grasp superfamily ATP-dependent carboligase